MPSAAEQLKARITARLDEFKDADAQKQALKTYQERGGEAVPWFYGCYKARDSSMVVSIDEDGHVEMSVLGRQRKPPSRKHWMFWLRRTGFNPAAFDLTSPPHYMILCKGEPNRGGTTCSNH